MLEYVRICLNLPEWLLFYNSSFPQLFYNTFSTWEGGYLFERLQETKGYSLKEYKAFFFFFEETNFDFFNSSRNQ